MSDIFTSLFEPPTLNKIANWVIHNHKDCKVYNKNQSLELHCGTWDSFAKYNVKLDWEIPLKIRLSQCIDANTSALCYVASIIISYIPCDTDWKTVDKFFGPNIKQFKLSIIDNRIDFFDKFKTAFTLCYEPIKNNKIEKYEMYIENVKNCIAIEKLS